MRPTCQEVDGIEGREDSGQGLAYGTRLRRTVLRCEGSVTMVADAGERAKGEVAGGGDRWGGQAHLRHGLRLWPRVH